MTLEEIFDELIETSSWNVPTSGIWVSDKGELNIPYFEDDTVDEILLDVDSWVENNAPMEYDDLSEVDQKWIVDKITKFFADKYEWYLQRQLMQLEKIND